MNSRALLTTINAVKTAVPKRNMAVITNFKPATLDELPVPQGDWATAYSAKQKKHNLVLLSGLAIFGGTIAFCCSGIVDFGIGPPLENFDE